MSRRNRHKRLLPNQVKVGAGVVAETGKSTTHAGTNSRRGIWGLALAFCLGAGAATMILLRNSSTVAAPLPDKQSVTVPPIAALAPEAARTQVPFKDPTTLAELLALPTGDLGKVDIAVMNLLCTQGLPGSENLDISKCLATLDDWTAKFKLYTEHHYDEYKRNPDPTHSWAQYRMMVVMSALSQGFGVHYDTEEAIAEYGFDPATAKGPATAYYPSHNLGPAFFAKSDTFFINGVLGPKHAGNCSSLPVLVAAISQRLGYPVRLVNAFRHTFVRWDDGKERFNIETTVVGGLQTVSDEEYHRWPAPLTPEMIAAEGYLQTLTPSQQLACFLYSREGCLLANGQIEEAEKLCPRCSELVPSSVKYRYLPSLQ